MVSTVYIAKSVYGGDGLGRLGDGRVVFVPGAFAGESVKAEIVEEKRTFVKARLVEVMEASPARLATPALAVPGMVYAQLDYAAELEAKEGQLRDFFERARIAVPELTRLEPLAEPLHYRNKVVYHFERRGADWVFGYREEPSHRIVEETEDPLAAPAIVQKWPEIRRAVVALLTQGPVAVRRDVERQGNVTIRWSARSGVKWWVSAEGARTVIQEETCGRVFEVPTDGFYQVNPVCGNRLVEAVVSEYRAGAAMAPRVLDLYCGVGVFGLSCQPPQLLGIESGRQAVEFAKRNAAALGQPEAKFFAERVGDNLRRIPLKAGTTVIVDPPRGGLEKGVAQWLAKSRAERILYVSCDPATLVRDLRPLASAFEVKSVRWIDMFPRTARFETFVTLERRR